ncbi:DUF2634 domain-containing protein [Cohnella silvisoli]|uniref:DUF2634 domain-containing protein n=1 Tax=Cohnella silvisoli TaxID=2873699 RepID=A0ABV1KM48_9BACL|nr:DUF2634 domain-containing protein [Cohnella silvisoli]MCD9020508.1 DUF2634 domain-containing protein [Cohnella silvisoli]
MTNLFPEEDISVDKQVSESGSISFGRSWRFDYDIGEFVMTPTGKVAGSSGTDAWLEWCKKALQTERFRYPIYSRNYGQEFIELIRSDLPRSAIETEIQRITEETLLTDPRTASVDSFSFEWKVDSCYFTCSISNIHDETETIQGKVVNS